MKQALVTKDRHRSQVFVKQCNICTYLGHTEHVSGYLIVCEVLQKEQRKKMNAAKRTNQVRFYNLEYDL